MDQAGKKTLVFSFDGTGNEPAKAGGFKQDESISNVFKLHLRFGGGIDRQPATRTASGRSQTAFHYNGIGTRQDGKTIPLLGRLYSAGMRAVNLTLAPEFSDAQQILDEATADLAAVYRPGDKIVVFGFSRGAALARKFATMLLDADEDRAVAFMGVFDTVAAMGSITSSDVAIEPGTLHDRVQRAVHVVAIDEDRVAFTPTLMKMDPTNAERISEIWFPGVHSDVGGGYWHDGLSDLALAFIIERCRQALGPDVAISHKTTAAQRCGQDGVNIAVDDYALEPRFDAPLHAHAGSWTLEQDVRRIQRWADDEASDSLPVLHYAVKLRVDHVADYRPPALRDLDFRLWLGAGKLSQPIHGIGGLRAYRLPWWWRLRRQTARNRIG